MSSTVQLGSAQLLPIKEATDLVPYSRDYIARLAREEKIVAVQIERQWFVDAESLKNFYAHVSLEETIRKRHLSTVRKNDLEVKELYRARLASIGDKQIRVPKTALIHTAAIMLCGFGVGLLLATTGQYLGSDSMQFVAQVPGRNESSAFAESAALLAEDEGAYRPVLTEYTLTETTTDLSLQNGIVLLPVLSTTSVQAVEEFFSDPVIVVDTSSTTGVIRAIDSAITSELPFVRVPQSVEVVPDGVGNEDSQ